MQIQRRGPKGIARVTARQAAGEGAINGRFHPDHVAGRHPRRLDRFTRNNRLAGKLSACRTDGHAITQGLLPLMTSQTDARIVTVTSGAQYFGTIRWDDLNWSQGYDRYGAYGQSKLANVMFALELHNRLQDDNSAVKSLAAHPGIARTNLQPAALASGGNRWEALAYRLMDPLFQSAEMGALPQLHAATAPSAQSGEHYGPSQFGGLRGSPGQCRIAPTALDPSQRKRLWALSEQLIGA